MLRCPLTPSQRTCWYCTTFSGERIHRQSQEVHDKERRWLFLTPFMRLFNRCVMVLLFSSAHLQKPNSFFYLIVENIALFTNQNSSWQQKHFAGKSFSSAHSLCFSHLQLLYLQRLNYHHGLRL